MSKDITISTRITEEMAAQLDQLSEQLGRSRSWLLHEALQTYLTSEQQFIEAVQAGLEDWQQEQVVSHDQVVADWSQRRAKSKQSDPKS
jgi:predicted transcriptional regulator